MKITKAIKAKAQAAFAKAYDRYSVKCAVSILGYAEASITKYRKEMLVLTESTDPLFKFVGETNLHACTFGMEVIEIYLNSFEEALGEEEWNKVLAAFEISSDEEVETVRKYWVAAAEAARSSEPKAGRITAEDLN